MSCLLICCLTCKKAIEREINFSLALYSVCGLVVGQNINAFFWKTEMQQVSICLKILENCKPFDSFGPFQFSNVSLTVGVISFEFLTLSEEEIKSRAFELIIAFWMPILLPSHNTEYASVLLSKLFSCI